MVFLLGLKKNMKVSTILCQNLFPFTEGIASASRAAFSRRNHRLGSTHNSTGLLSALVNLLLLLNWMDSDLVVDFCASLSLEEGARPDILISEEHRCMEKLRLRKCLVGKVLCLKLVNQDAFKITIFRAWQTLRVKGVVKSIGDSKFIFEFVNEIDKRRVLLEGLWLFNNTLVILEQLKNVSDISLMKFETQEFWIRVA